MLDYGQQPQAACDAPRWKVNRDFTHRYRIDPAIRETARRLKPWAIRSNPIDDPYMDFGSGQYIWKLDRNDPERGYVAASDSRRDGLAAGF